MVFSNKYYKFVSLKYSIIREEKQNTSNSVTTKRFRTPVASC